MKRMMLVLVLLAIGSPAVAQYSVQARQAWIGIAISCTECMLDGPGGRWRFSSPPEAYSVEPGSPAYEAGVRRGDQLTHVNDLSLTTEAGAQRWGRIQPGDPVRLRYLRNGVVRTATFTAAEPRSALRSQDVEHMRELESRLARTDSASRAVHQHARALIEEQLRTEQSSHASMQSRLQELQSYMRGLNAEEQRRADALLRDLVREQQTLHTREARAMEELARRNQALEQRLVSPQDARRTAAQQALSDAYERAAGERLRYSGTLGTTDIEVRGVSPVTVEEMQGELVIKVGDTIVRLTQRERR
jgi:hypothetical protein